MKAMSAWPTSSAPTSPPGSTSGRNAAPASRSGGLPRSAPDRKSRAPAKTSQGFSRAKQTTPGRHGETRASPALCLERGTDASVGRADLGRLHRALCLGPAVIDGAVAADHSPFLGSRLLLDDAAVFRLVLHDPEGGLGQRGKRQADDKRTGECDVELHLVSLQRVAPFEKHAAAARVPARRGRGNVRDLAVWASRKTRIRPQPLEPAQPRDCGFSGDSCVFPSWSTPPLPDRAGGHQIRYPRVG